jgi:hypothetical protein
MAKIGTYPGATALAGTEELIGVQSASSVKITTGDLKQYIHNSVYKDAAFTAVAGDAVYVNSSGGPVTITLPITPSANDAVAVMDCGGVASVQGITVGRNGETINGAAEDFLIDQNFGQALFIYNGTTWTHVLVGTPTVVDANTVFVVYKIANYTANSGERVMVGSDTGAITITLPATPAAGYSVGVWDADNGASTNNITIARNGETIDGVAADDVINVNGGKFEYVFDGSTWKRPLWTEGMTPVFKTANYTANPGEEVFCDSTAGPFTITLPATPLDTNRVIVHGGPAAVTYNVTVGRNGETINGVAEDFVIDQNYGTFNGAYDGVTDNEWKNAPDGNSDLVNLNDYVTGRRSFSIPLASFGWTSVDTPTWTRASSTTIDTTVHMPEWSFPTNLNKKLGAMSVMPDDWNGDVATVTVEYVWAPSTTDTGNCLWWGNLTGINTLSAGQTTSATFNGVQAANGTIRASQRYKNTAHMNSVVAGDPIFVFVQRRGADASDTFTGAALLLSVSVSYIYGV